MSRAVESCGVALALSALLTPVVRNVCIRFGLFDPLGPLKIHQHPIPRLGGIAINVAFVVGCVVGNHFRVIALVPFLGCFMIVWIFGLVDDVRGLSPLVRLSAQAAAGLLLWWSSFRFHPLSHSAWNGAAICAIAVFVCNSINFADGSDGLAAGVSAIIALSFTVAGGANPAHVGVVAASLLGACAGFLLYNRPPASIFMGDGGSTTVGFVLAFLMVSLSQTNPGKPGPFLFAFVVAALPLLDALLAVIRRVRARKSPFSGDRRHAYDIAAAHGWSARKIMLVSFAVTASLGGFGWVGLRIQSQNFAILTIVILALLFAIGFRLGSIRGEVEQKGREERVCSVPEVSAATTTPL